MQKVALYFHLASVQKFELNLEFTNKWKKELLEIFYYVKTYLILTRMFWDRP